MAGVLYDPTKPMPLIQMVNSPQWIGVKPTVGQRNNNPGNLRSFDAFQGKTGQGKGGYDIYDTLDNGARALARDLHTKSKRGVKTVRDLMTGYAPPSDNNPTGSYIDYVANDLGVDPDQEIDIANMRPKLMRSITKFENKNRDILSDDMIAQAIAAADGESPDMPNQQMPPGGYPSIAGPLADGNLSIKDLTDQANRAIAPDGFYADQIPLVDMQRLGVNPYPVAASDGPALTFDDVMARQGNARQSFQDQYTAATNPALTMPGDDTPGILANAGNYTNNTRSQTPLSITPPNQNIDFAERMVRMGAAGLGAMNKGPAAQMAAMGMESANIDDMQRASLEKYRLAELKAKKGKTNAVPQQSPYTGVVLDTIDTIFAQVEEGGNDMLWPFDNVTGGIGKAMSYIPGSPAHDVASNIDTIVSSIGFERLQKMRDDSPTGGALGAISEKELALLNSALGSLRQSQSREQFLKNLRRVKDHYQASVQAIREQQIEYARINGLPIPAMTVSGQAAAGNQAASSNLDAARAIISQR